MKKEMARWVKFRVIQDWCPSFKALFTPNLVQKGKKKDCRKKHQWSPTEISKKKRKTWSSPARLNATPFRTEARKYNQWATGGLLVLGSKFDGTYMHMKCAFYWQLNLALEYDLWKLWTPLDQLETFFKFIIKSLRNKKNWLLYEDQYF